MSEATDGFSAMTSDLPMLMQGTVTNQWSRRASVFLESVVKRVWRDLVMRLEGGAKVIKGRRDGFSEEGTSFPRIKGTLAPWGLVFEVFVRGGHDLHLGRDGILR